MFKGIKMKKCIYDYQNRCACAEDDNCGCDYDNNMTHDVTCHIIKNTEKSDQKKDIIKTSKKNATNFA